MWPMSTSLLVVHTTDPFGNWGMDCFKCNQKHHWRFSSPFVPKPFNQTLKYRINRQHTWMCMPSFSMTSRYWGRARTIFCISLVDISCPPLFDSKVAHQNKITSSELQKFDLSKNSWKARLLSFSSQIANRKVNMEYAHPCGRRRVMLEIQDWC